MSTIDNENGNAAVVQQVSNKKITDVYKDGETKVVKLTIKKAKYIPENTSGHGLERSFAFNFFDKYKGRNGSMDAIDCDTMYLPTAAVFEAMTHTREFARVVVNEPIDVIEDWLQFATATVELTWHADVEELHKVLTDIKFDEEAIEEMKLHREDAISHRRKRHVERLDAASQQ